MDKRLQDTIAFAQTQFRNRLEQLIKSGSGLTIDHYARYLSMQYFLTKGVQRHFFRLAGNSVMTKRRSLRKFLVTFANEEELHFEIALGDLKQLGRTPTDCPLDVTLWWAYFDSILDTNPFIRLGATAILENIAVGSSDVIGQLFSKASFITEKNSRFFVIHQHGPNLAHGDQILAALSEAHLEAAHWDDVVKGAEIATVLYLRMVDWALDTQARSSEVSFFQGLIAA
jgi:hypothetical protein